MAGKRELSPSSIQSERAGTKTPSDHEVTIEDRIRVLKAECEDVLGHACLRRSNCVSCTNRLCDSRSWCGDRCGSCSLDAAIASRPVHRRADVYAALSHGLRLKSASDALSSAWCRERDSIFDRVKKDLRKLMRHVRQHPSGRHLSVDVALSIVVDVLLREGRRGESKGSPDGESFDDYAQRMKASEQAAREGLQAVFRDRLEQRHDFRGFVVEMLVAGKPLKSRLANDGHVTRTATAGDAPSVHQGRRRPRKGGARAGSGRRPSVWRQESLAMLVRAGETKESAEWLLELSGLTGSYGQR